MRLNITAEMGRKQLTQKQTAILLNVSAPTLKRYINGGNMPVQKLVEMAELFNRPMDYLLENIT